MRRISLFCIKAMTLIVLLFGGAGLESASAGTFTVTNVNDSGPGSLRQAILDARRSAPPRLVNFAIGSGVQTISPLSPLPHLNADLSGVAGPVTIDGTTQPGFTGTPIIEIKAELVITVGGCTIRGLVIPGIYMTESGGNVIEGNYIGTDVTGRFSAGNSGDGIRSSATSGAHVIRGNIISGNGGHGVSLRGATSVVENNFIGTDASGTFALGNSLSGVWGDWLIVRRNVISGNGQHGIVSLGTNRFQGNLIGTDVTGTLPIGNSGAGIRAQAFDDIGGPNPEDGNIIAFNGDDGVIVVDNSALILSNSIFSNGGLGIDIDDDGVTLNDACEADSTPIPLQNYPVLTSVIKASGNTVIQGTLDSKPNSSFLIQFFSNEASDPSGFGEGQTLIGSITVNSGASCVTSFVATFPSSSVPGGFITATATEDGSGSTSEFSQCAPVINQGAPAIQALLNDIANLLAQGVLSESNANKLTSKLRAALQKLERGNQEAAADQIDAFINQVQTLIRSGKLSPEQGQPLIDAAMAVF